LEPLLKVNLWAGGDIYNNGVYDADSATYENISPSDGVWNDVQSKRFSGGMLMCKYKSLGIMYI
jgi:hypothetical protein